MSAEAMERLIDVLQGETEAHYGAGAKIEGLTRLSAGASRETWSFDVLGTDGARIPLILKRDPLVYDREGRRIGMALGVSRAAEGRLAELAAGVGVPAPAVEFYLEDDERTTPGLVMERIEGETLGRRIVREEALREARTKLAYQCGHAAARIHSIPLAKLPRLESRDNLGELARCREILDQADHAYPGFEYGLRWLEERVELAGDRRTLVHGDFRNGNIIVGPDGLRAVLDWEISHVGNPLVDLGWMCVRSWRYGAWDKPVGGFGEIEELLAGYEAGGGPAVDRRELHYWEVFGTLYWGMLCITMAFAYLAGGSASFEQAMVGRRSAETEYDLLALLD